MWRLEHLGVNGPITRDGPSKLDILRELHTGSNLRSERL
jgi:hypothetical protein